MTEPNLVKSWTLTEYLANQPTLATPIAPAKRVRAIPTLKLKSPSRSMAAASPQIPHVVLHGIVGTPPNLIAKRSFVLLNAAGQGILVHTNALQPTPKLGERVSITGSLITNDDGVRLDMRARDRWTPSTLKLAEPVPILHDIFKNDATHFWTLVDVTGRVEARSSNRLHLTLDETDVVVMLPAVLGYRSARVKIGDKLRLIGLLDTQSNPPRLYPRTVDDITLIQPIAAPTLAPTNTAGNLPPWMPVATAGATIATGYGLRRLRAWYTERRLTRQLSTAIEQLSTS